VKEVRRESSLPSLSAATEAAYSTIYARFVVNLGSVQ